MLDHLRQKAAQTLASTRSVTLSSYGPADIQASRVLCEAQDLTLYIVIPRSSNHLLNLENRPAIVATTDTWDLQGNARVLNREEIPVGIALPETGSAIIAIQPTRLTIHSLTGLGNIETIDF